MWGDSQKGFVIVDHLHISDFKNILQVCAKTLLKNHFEWTLVKDKQGIFSTNISYLFSFYIIKD